MTEFQLKEANRLAGELHSMKEKLKEVDKLMDAKGLSSLHVNGWPLDINYVDVEVMLTLYRSKLYKKRLQLEKEFEAVGTTED